MAALASFMLTRAAFLAASTVGKPSRPRGSGFHERHQLDGQQVYLDLLAVHLVLDPRQPFLGRPPIQQKPTRLLYMLHDHDSLLQPVGINFLSSTLSYSKLHKWQGEDIMQHIVLKG